MCQYVSSASGMKYILVLVLFAVVAFATEASTSHTNCIACADWPKVNKTAKPPKTRNYQLKWGVITQRVDNFDPLNSARWQMRYLESDEHYEPGGPIFIMLGGNHEINETWLLSSQMRDMAEMHGAYMYHTEHRFYGGSSTTNDMSVENLKYLTTPQALADVAHFIAEKKRDSEFENSKVVLFGGFYGGSMAVWMRQKYPNLVHAAVASSAPLLAKVDFSEYAEVVKQILGNDCASVLMNGSAEIRRLVGTGQTTKVEKDFNLCSPIKNDYAIQNLFSILFTNISNIVQYATPDSVPNLCSKLQDPSLSSDYDRFVSYFRDDRTCRVNLEIVDSSSKATQSGRQWDFQTCTEFGFYKTTWSNESLFHFGTSLDFASSMCQKYYDSSFTPEFIERSVMRTNQMYGGLKPKVTRVVYVYGAADPWHVLGLPQDYDPYTTTYIVDGASHCADMYPLDVYVNEEMRDVKLNVVSWINAWLSES